ncbi:hypothetical protein HGI15_10170 [Modestobacter lapidis]|nr:hypothetical protein [Modestobacter lapidis]
MSCPTASAGSNPQNAVNPPEKQATDCRLALQMLASAVKPLVCTPRPGLEERQVVGDGVDREKT